MSAARSIRPLLAAAACSLCTISQQVQALQAARCLKNPSVRPPRTPAAARAFNFDAHVDKFKQVAQGLLGEFFSQVFEAAMGREDIDEIGDGPFHVVDGYDAASVEAAVGAGLKGLREDIENKVFDSLGLPEEGLRLQDEYVAINVKRCHLGSIHKFFTNIQQNNGEQKVQYTPKSGQYILGLLWQPQRIVHGVLVNGQRGEDVKTVEDLRKQLQKAKSKAGASVKLIFAAKWTEEDDLSDSTRAILEQQAVKIDPSALPSGMKISNSKEHDGVFNHENMNRVFFVQTIVYAKWNNAVQDRIAMVVPAVRTRDDFSTSSCSDDRSDGCSFAISTRYLRFATYQEMFDAGLIEASAINPKTRREALAGMAEDREADDDDDDTKVQATDQTV